MFDRCSLACDRIAPVLQDFSQSPRATKRLCLSLSHHESRESEDEGMRFLQRGQRHGQDVCLLIGLCSTSLEILELHWYKLTHLADKDAPYEEKCFLNHTMDIQSPNLKRLSLKGIHTSENALQSFPCKTTLTSLNLEAVHLSPGTFGPIFDYVVSPDLEYLHLDDLVGTRLICFDVPSQPHCPQAAESGPNDPTTFGADARMPIKYRHFPRGRVLGSAAAFQLAP